MDENDINNQNDEIILKEQLDINLNDLFTIDFKNLKIFLTTILKNQNKISQKMNIIESTISDKDKKNDKYFSLLNKKIKVIENNYELNSDKLNSLQKGLEDKIKKEKEERKEFEEKKDFEDKKEAQKEENEKIDFEKNREEPEYIITNSNLEIISNKKDEITSTESLNNTKQNIEKEILQEKETEKEKEPEKITEIKNEIKNEDDLNKELDKEKENEIKIDFKLLYHKL